MDIVLKKLIHIKLSNYYSEDKERSKKLIHMLWRSVTSVPKALSVHLNHILLILRELF